jgi:hypothetical protein
MGRWHSAERLLSRQERADLTFGVFSREELDDRIQRTERAYRSLKSSAKARARKEAA